MKSLIPGLMAGAGLLLASTAHAAVIDFDDLDAGGKLASLSKNNPYAGLVWSASWYLGDTAVAGYDNGAHSGTEFVLNGFGTNHLSISSATPFAFAGAWFATPNTNGAKASWVNITAYDSANQLIGSTGNIAISSTYAMVAANFGNVARLDIARDKGWFVMDDLAFSRAATVPEPGSMALLGLGAAAMGWAARRRENVAARRGGGPCA
ncbi:PEP-CTERM sorting domain-containing protein [Massilia sp. Root351]|jgi:hypothetical protein|uniref:PEP-CTERM sorting domain-containing protein n=1 Tax=Massilia sp. Root351 TaxID=1736522 RepID=UPI0009EAAFCB|nr:PEP-CTERM sorting domain-containing protein [Massilia sp. Root351]